jgi:mannosyltransferase
MAGIGPALLPALLTLTLGVVGLGRQAWRDEHATWYAATLPWDALVSRLSQVDIVLLPYYLLMRPWIAVFGDSVLAMRLPSLLAMACAAGLTGWLGSRLFDRWVGLAAGCLFALVPSVSRFAQEARPYAFAIAFAVASLVAVLARRWWLVSLMVALVGLAHLVALLVLLAHVPVVLREGPSRWRPWVFAVGVGLVPVIPIAAAGLRQTGQVAWIDAGWRSLATLPFSLARSAAVAGILAALAIVGILGRKWDWRLTTLTVWGLGPPLVFFVVAHDLFYYRYLLFVLPAWVLAAGLALRRRAVAIAAVGAALLLGVPDQLALRRSPLPGDQDYRAAAAYVARQMSPSDGIRFEGYPDRRERLGFAYELRDRATPTECDECAQRLWLVSNSPNATIPRGFAVVETRTFAGIIVYFLRATPT